MIRGSNIVAINLLGKGGGLNGSLICSGTGLAETTGDVCRLVTVVEGYGYAAGGLR